MKIHENLLTLGKMNRPGIKLIEMLAVTLHWPEAPNQKPEDTRAWFESGKTYGSTHYIIGTDGKKLQTLPEDEVGYHIGSSQIDPVSKKIYTDKARALMPKDAFSGKINSQGYYITPNYYSIGIEMGHLNMFPGDFSEATLNSTAELCADILKRYRKTIDILVTHNEIVGWKDCPRLWVNNPALFFEFKNRVKNLM